jgi:hypothetical protein
MCVVGLLVCCFCMFAQKTEGGGGKNTGKMGGKFGQKIGCNPSLGHTKNTHTN